jgi:transposase
VLAIAHLLDGMSRADAASACGMDRQTLRDWVHRYNAQGIAGLSDALRSGRPPALSDDQLSELKDLVLAGPDLERDGVVRWRCIDLRSVIKERYEVEIHERTVGKLLRRMGMTRVQPRPYHPKKDADAQRAFKKTSPPS